MGKLILVTGGARSGKSTFAESIIRKLEGDVLYIATSIPFDEEMKERVKKHREQRPPHWTTIEAYKNLDKEISAFLPGKAAVLPGEEAVLPGEEAVLPGKAAVLLDCITIMVSNLMLEKDMDWEGVSIEEINIVEETVKSEVGKLLNIINTSQALFVIVTNELGMGVVPPTELGRAIRDIAGRANQILATAADEVYLCVSGIPVKIK